MTNMQTTSLDAYFELKKTPTIGDQSRKILAVMLPNMTYTRRGLAALTKLETSTASARINSLLDIYIEVIGTVKDPMTNKTVQALKIPLAKTYKDKQKAVHAWAKVVKDMLNG